MADPIDCPVVKSLGTDDPNNVFNCNATQTCCTVNLLPACCSKDDTNHAITMQVQLWLPLLAIVILIALFIWWCRTDEAFCDVEKPCLYRCGCKKYAKDEIEEVRETNVNGSRVSLRSTKSSTTLLHDAEVDPKELEVVAENLDASPDDEPVVAPKDDNDEDDPTEDEPKEDEDPKEDDEPKEDEEAKEDEEPKDEEPAE